MRPTGKRKKAQSMILDEVKKQLVLQAERWGRAGHYTPLKLEEIELDAVRRILSDLLAERANLEYEMQTITENKKDIDIKLSRLQSYLKRAERVGQKHDKNITKMIDKLVGDRKKTNNALDVLKFKHEGLVSVMLSDN